MKKIIVVLSVVILGLLAFIYIRRTATTVSEPPAVEPQTQSDATETESSGTESDATKTESDGTETESDGTESGGDEPTEPETPDEPEAEDPLTKIESNGVTLRTFVDRVIEIAQNEPENPVVDGKTKYGELFGAPSAAWCTEFVMYCIKQAETELGTSFIKSVYPWKDSAYSTGLWFKRHNRYYEPKDGYIPTAGDIVLFDMEKHGYPDHTGLVIGTEEDEDGVYIITIEGNIPGDKPKVIRSRRLKVNDKTIVCYGSTWFETEYTGNKEDYD